MSCTKIMFRLDDAHGRFNKESWEKCVGLIEKFGVPGLIGIIPMSLDMSIDYGPQDFNLKTWCQERKVKGWSFAHHGYTHILKEGTAFEIRYSNKGEFISSSYELILNELRIGRALLENIGIETNVFFAPKHSYTTNLLRALKQSGFEVISDGISLFNYWHKGLKFIPQYLSFPNRFLANRVVTICLHPSTMKGEDFEKLEELLRSKDYIPISWGDIVNRKTYKYGWTIIFRILFSLRYRKIL
jgi:hypothetical protein